MKKIFLTDLAATLFILLFIYAATSKLTDLPKFKTQIGQSPLLTAMAGWVAWLIPAIEIIIAMALFTKAYRVPALYASYSLMVLFTAYIIAITRFSAFIPCSCGGILSKMSWNQHLVFNIFFLFIAAAGLLAAPAARTEQAVP